LIDAELTVALAGPAAKLAASAVRSAARVVMRFTSILQVGCHPNPGPRPAQVSAARASPRGWRDEIPGVDAGSSSEATSSDCIRLPVSVTSGPAVRSRATACRVDVPGCSRRVA
jgi:hypothetical protein